MKHVETISLPHDLSEFSEIIDVRSPSEYQEDHVPGATNLPVLSDAERKEVGILYKSDPFAARRLGAQIISNNVSQHLKSYLASKERTYTPLLYCWRGGMRSNSIAHILRSIGWRARVLEGGYKAFRKFITEDLEKRYSDPNLQFSVLEGPTGVAKTQLLHSIREQGGQILDLEGIANHKGSVLGLEPDTTQPSQKQFETRLWQTVTRLDITQPIFTEAESNRIGKVHCPPALWKKLGESQVTTIHMPLSERAQFLLNDYAYFTENPHCLKKLLKKLTRLRGRKQIDQWHKQIDAEEWTNFVESILRDHYDLVYRHAGDEKSNYPAPSHTLELKDASPKILQTAANTLINRA